MDERHFDAITRVISVSGARRSLLGLLVVLPFAGGLFGGFDETQGKDRRRRRKTRHRKHARKRMKQRKHAQCKADSKAKTCADRCGQVRNNCGKSIDCGPCLCNPPCAACSTCDSVAGACVGDPDQEGQACGAPGQLCAPDGACVCTASSCPACEVCGAGGVCTACGGGQICCSDQCVEGVCCTEGQCIDAWAPDCIGHECTCTANGGNPCDGDESCCEGAGCIDLQTDAENCGSCGNACGTGQSCRGGVCGIACGSDLCLVGSEICVQDTCVACDITCVSADNRCDGEDLQNAIETSNVVTLYVCPSSYTGGFTIANSLELVGAGQGGDPTVDTILDGELTYRVIEVTGPSVVLRSLRVTRGAGRDGAGILVTETSELEMEDCAIFSNKQGGYSGGGISNSGGVTLTDCLVAENVGLAGGGLVQDSGTMVLINTVIRKNGSSRGGAGVYIAGGSLTVGAGTIITENDSGHEFSAGGVQTVEESDATFAPGSSVINNLPFDCRIDGTSTGTCGP